MEDVRATSLSRPGEGHLTALGYLQIGTGSLTLAMSLLTLGQAMFSHAELFHPSRVFNYSSDFFDRFIAAYVILQLTFGWLAGALQLAAGICCLRCRHPRLMWIASIASLVNFPNGTMASILMLHGLTRPEITAALK